MSWYVRVGQTVRTDENKEDHLLQFSVVVRVSENPNMINGVNQTVFIEAVVGNTLSVFVNGTVEIDSATTPSLGV